MEFSKINIQKIMRNGDVPVDSASSYFSINSGGGDSVDLGPVYSSISGINVSLSAVSSTTVALSAVSHSHSNKAVIDKLSDNQLNWIDEMKDKISFDSTNNAIKFDTNIYSVSGVSAFGSMDNKATIDVDLSNYYTKNQTSSKTEISNAISKLQVSIPTGLSVDLSNYYKKNETSGATELSTKFSNYFTKEEVNSSLSGINASLSADTANIKILKDLFSWETDEREGMFGGLRDLITAETKSRTDNDAYISGVCTGLNSAISSESTNRVNADNSLNNSINSETKSRKDNDAYLSGVCTGLSSSLSTVSATTVSLSKVSHTHNNKSVIDKLSDNQLNWINILKDKIEFDSKNDAIKFNTNIYSVSGVSAFGSMNNKAEVDVDLTNYYKKNETSSKTEISNAISSLQSSIPTGLNSAISSEATNRINGDNSLNNIITSETKNRKDNDAYISGVCTGLSSSLSSESTKRANGDVDNHNAITAETSSRINGDNSLNNAITAETSSRTTAIDTVNKKIATESTNRINGDNSLNNAITAETKSRTDNDAYLSGVCTGLSSSLSSESTNRINGDTNNHNAITAETSSRVNGDNALSNSITAETAERKAQDGNLSNRIQQLENLLSHLTWDNSINAYRVSGSLYATQGLTALKQ